VRLFCLGALGVGFLKGVSRRQLSEAYLSFFPAFRDERVLIGIVWAGKTTGQRNTLGHFYNVRFFLTLPDVDSRFLLRIFWHSFGLNFCGVKAIVADFFLRTKSVPGTVHRSSLFIFIFLFLFLFLLVYP
jgi:hypothetical protein